MEGEAKLKRFSHQSLHLRQEEKCALATRPQKQLREGDSSHTAELLAENPATLTVIDSGAVANMLWRGDKNKIKEKLANDRVMNSVFKSTNLLIEYFVFS